MYYHKYLKYKHKYLKLAKKIQTGGADLNNPITSTFLIYNNETNDFKAINIKSEKYSTEIVNNIIKETTEIEKNRKYVRFINNKSPENLRQIDIISKDGTETNVIYHGGQFASKKITFNMNNVVIKLEYLEYTDEAKTTGSGNITISHSQVETTINLFGTFTMNKQDKIRKLNGKITNVRTSNDNLINISNNPIVFEGLKALIELMTPKDVTIKDFYNVCKSKINFGQYDPKIRIILEDVALTLCKKFNYLGPVNSEKLMKFKNIIPTIISMELDGMIKELIHKYSNEAIRQNTIDSIYKDLPSHVMPKDMLFKGLKTEEDKRNNNYTYFNLPDNYNIILDSGNDAVTLIHTNVINFLGLERHRGCIISVRGVSNKSDEKCGYYVFLTFKIGSINKEYTIVAFEDNAIPNQLLVGHVDGLNKLFADNFRIYEQYNPNDPNIKSIKQESEYINTSAEIFFELLHSVDNALNMDSNLGNNLNTLYMKYNRQINKHIINDIHIFMEGVDSNKMKRLFDLFKQVLNKMETKNVADHDLYKLIKNAYEKKTLE